MRYLVFVILAFLISACSGYKPAPQYAKDIFEEPVLVKVKMDPEDPNAGVFLQDEIANMAVNRLNLTLTKDVNVAKSYIVVNSYTINTTPLNYDDNGNVIRYSVNAAIEFAIKDKYGFWSKNIVASEYVSVKPDSLASALDKEKAGKVAIKKALDTFIVAVMERSRKVSKNKKEPKKEPLKVKTADNIEANQPKVEIFQTKSEDDNIKAPLDEFDINVVHTSEGTFVEDTLDK